MKLTVIITKGEIVGLVHELAPVRVDLALRRSVAFGPPEKVELVAGSGLRIRGDARVVWKIAGLAVPVSVGAWQILLVPKVEIREGALILAFDPSLELLELERTPGFLSERVADAINEGVSAQRPKLAWNVSRSLSRRFLLSKRLTPARTFAIGPTSASVAVSEAEVRVEASFEAHVGADAVPPAVVRRSA